jgi:hypothetical protein
MTSTTIRRAPSNGSLTRRLLLRLGLVVAAACAAVLLVVPTASAHVVPTSAAQLVVEQNAVQAEVSIPLTDIESATGLDLGGGAATSATATAKVKRDADAIRAYLLDHVHPTTDSGQAWAVSVGNLTVVQAGDQRTTGLYQQMQTTVTLIPPVGADVRSFDLDYDAVVEKVATHVVIVTVQADWSGGSVESPYEVGTISRDTVTGAITPLHVDLGSGSNLRGFASMIRLGVQHIAEGTDHQLFLLTLLLPAPLLAARGRWRGAVSTRMAVRRITTITLAFTLGHSVTLALGALGVPVPQQPVEALIAVSILVAAAHAVRPLFPGREALVAACFGLVHGLAFSQTLRDLDLSGSRLVLSLLGFNLGIELMQLVVVTLVLPPLVLLARAGRYHLLRVAAATLTGLAASGWLVARLGWANPVADAADSLGTAAAPVVAILWGAALVLHWHRRSLQRSPTSEHWQPLERPSP